jgi:3-oxoacyl-[acyl-carrier-protein] synthase-3
MFILGVGAAHPEGEVTDEFLASIGSAPTAQEAQLLSRFGVKSRRTSLPHDYITTTKNKEVLDGRSVALASPTSLAVTAVHQALQRAGITAEQVGLILADTATPYQTCPSEAQRIGGALGIKIPAYDIVAGSATLPLYLEMLSSWKPERIPDYVLCVSTNTLSQHVAYSGSALAAYLYGDAAAAFVVSPRQPGKFTVIESYLERRGSLKASSVVERHLSFATDALLPKEEVQEMLAQGLQRVSREKAPTAIVGPQLYSGEFAEYEGALGLSSGALVSATTRTGYALGASCGVALSSLWDVTKEGADIAVLHVGDGVWSGSMLASE